MEPFADTLKAHVLGLKIKAYEFRLEYLDVKFT